MLKGGTRSPTCRWSLSDVGLIDAEMGLDLVSFRGTRPWILPMQARYLIGQDDVIAFANVAFDYDQRAEPTAILPALARLAAAAKLVAEEERRRVRREPVSPFVPAWTENARRT
jgi:hypothetical protein